VQVAYDYQAERSRPLSAEERGHLEAILEPAPAG
jgi:hypothetical protein